MRMFIIALTILFIITSSVIGLYHDVSGSMDDTLLAGDAFIVLKCRYDIRLPFSETLLMPLSEPHQDDILIFRSPMNEHEIIVKRCVAEGGQEIEITEKTLIVDGRMVPIPSLGKHSDPETIPAGIAGRGKRDYMPLQTIPDSTIFVLGDNRDYSVDSRIWGALPKELIRGKVLCVLWSIDPEASWRNPLQKIRWNRFLHHVH